MKYLHLFETQSERDSAASQMTPPWVAFVKENNSLGMHNDKTASEMFNVQTKSVRITENGTTTITADFGYGAMDRVNVTVDVPSSGNSGNWLHINGQYEDWDHNYLTRGYINALFNLDTYEVIDNSFAFTPEEGENGNPEIFERITGVGFEDGKLCFYNLPNNQLNPCTFSLDSDRNIDIKIIRNNPNLEDNTDDLTSEFIRNIKSEGFNIYYFEAPSENNDFHSNLEHIVFTINGAEVCAKTQPYTFYIDDVEYKTSKGMSWYQWANSDYNTNGYWDCYRSDSNEHQHPRYSIVDANHTKYIVESKWDSTAVYDDDTIQIGGRYATVDIPTSA